MKIIRKSTSSELANFIKNAKIEKDVLIKYSGNDTSICISKNITSIGDRTFDHCTSLTGITIPNNVTSIGSRAFNNCSSLKNATVPSSITCSISSDAFEGCPFNSQSSNSNNSEHTSSKGCYVATAVYGSYDCPQVWTLRRYRDDILSSTWYGRAFIYTYYAISSTLVKWFGDTKWFKKMWQGKLDRMIAKLNAKGVEDAPYEE